MHVFGQLKERCHAFIELGGANSRASEVPFHPTSAAPSRRPVDESTDVHYGGLALNNISAISRAPMSGMRRVTGVAM